jgi:hypothetical protein
MNESIRGPISRLARRRNLIAMLGFGMALMVISSPRAKAGAIHAQHMSKVGARSLVAIEKADPNSDYWARALQHHTLKLKGPHVPTVVTMNADGTVSQSSFLLYMQWRESLNSVRFDSFHTQVAKLLRKMKPTPTPGTIPPLAGPVPIQPPDFTPITTSSQSIIPPQVPEPSAGLAAVVLIGAGIVGRRLARRP